MHRVIQDRLEKILQAKDRVTGVAELTGVTEVDEHLSNCAECAREVEEFRAQSPLFGALRVEAEPSAGFYARVLQQIEYRARNSMWAVFVSSPFGRRLAYASLAMALLLGTYVVGTESEDGHLTGNVARIEQSAPFDTPVRGGETDRRDTVLVNFANYEPQAD
jgi:anti-sigma factor RsiW